MSQKKKIKKQKRKEMRELKEAVKNKRKTIVCEEMFKILKKTGREKNFIVSENLPIN